MQRKRSWTLTLAAILAFALLVSAGCAKKSNETAKDSGASTTAGSQIAIYANSSDIMVFWDPSDSFSNEIIAMNNIYETLLRYDASTDKFEPVLAETYKHSDDGLTWTFNLRHGVKFHGSGKEMTAEDVKKSVERTVTRGKGASFIWGALDKVEVKDPYTVEFKLKNPTQFDLVVASGYGAHIFDVDYAKAQGDTDWFNQGKDAGTGPYTVASWKKGEDLVLSKFDGYWKGWNGKHFDKVVFRTITEPATRQQAMDSGEIDFTNNLPPDVLPSYEKSKDLEVAVAPSYQNILGLINSQKISNPKVREALAWAFPYEQIVSSVAKGYATQSQGVVPVGMWGHSTSVPLRKQDLDKAKALLAEAGAKDLKLTITYSAGDDTQRQVSELFGSALQKVGVTAEVKGMPWEAQWDLSKSKDVNQRQDILIFYWWPDVATPDTWHRNMFHTESDVVFNLSYYHNAAYDAIIDDAVKQIDRSVAAAKYAEAEQVLYKDAPVIPIFDIKYTRVKKKSLKGFVDNAAYPNVVFFYDTHRE